MSSIPTSEESVRQGSVTSIRGQVVEGDKGGEGDKGDAGAEEAEEAEGKQAIGLMRLLTKMLKLMDGQVTGQYMYYQYPVDTPYTVTTTRAPAVLKTSVLD